MSLVVLEEKRDVVVGLPALQDKAGPELLTPDCHFTLYLYLSAALFLELAQNQLVDCIHLCSLSQSSLSWQ